MRLFLRRLRMPVLGATALGIATVGWLIAADHIDSPLVQDDAGADIADVYTFLSPQRPDNIVLPMTLHGFIPPEESSISIFDPGVLYQFKIDTDGDAVEDLVIQAVARGKGRRQVMQFIGPVRPKATGTDAVLRGGLRVTVPVSTTPKAVVKSRRGIKVFAGVRDDPFFFDFGQFVAILNGDATSFNDPGFDSFAGFNVYTIVVELPLAMLGHPSDLAVWGTTSRLDG